MTYFEILTILKKEQLTIPDLNELFGPIPPNIKNESGKIELASSKYYQFINSKEFIDRHNLSELILDKLKEALEIC